MTEEERRIPTIALLLMIAGVIVFLAVVFPNVMQNVQSESGACGKEFRGPITYISSLKSDKNVEGSFFLGMGSIRTERVYVAYTGNNEIGYSLFERPIAESLLFEDTNTNPYVEEVDVMICTGMGYDMIKRYKFHVPEGTIKMEYAV
jgi:hypothetical protein